MKKVSIVGNAYTLAEAPNGGLDLLKDKKVTFCPFQTITMGQNELSQEIVRIKQPCNSLCPHFNFAKKPSGKLWIRLTCGAGVNHPIDDVQAGEEKESGKNKKEETKIIPI